MKETHLDRSISSVPAICQNTKVISSAPGLLEKLISRVSQGKMWAETKRTLIMDCKNLKNNRSRRDKKPGSIIIQE